MSKFLAFTVTSDTSHPGFKRLQRSADFWGWDLKVQHQEGWDRTNYRAEQLGQLEAFRKWEPEFFLYLDAWDTVFTGPKQELPLHRGVVSFAGDTIGFAWPHENLAPDYAETSWFPPVEEHEFRFVNAGVIWGDAAKMQSLAGEYLHCPYWLINQDYLNRKYAFEASVGLPYLRVDTRAESALNIMQVQKRFFRFEETTKRVKYVPTGTRPLVVHSPGTGITKPLAPMPPALEEMFGERNG